MWLAAISDIHGNLPALEAVLADIHQENFEAIVVCGDLIAGPMPVETLSLLQQQPIPVHYLHGNAESEVLRQEAGADNDALPPHVKEIVAWVAKQLSPEQTKFLSNWPANHQFEIDGLGRALFCHATPENDVDVFTQLTPEEKLLPIFSKVSADVVICGHTHMQFERTVGRVKIVNAGSVGMPFGKTGSDWLAVGKNIEFRHTDYDLAAAAERIRQTDYPQAEDFAANNVLQPPSAEEALAIFTKMGLTQKEL